MTITIIVAVARNLAIGKDNKLLWHLPEDMRFFKQTTLGHPVITGRKNYESIPEKFRPLPGRLNVVVTKQQQYTAPGATVVFSLEEAIEVAKRAADKEGKNEVFIIGGGMIYREALEKNLVNRILITKVDCAPEADTFFPQLAERAWKSTTIRQPSADENNPLSFRIEEWVKRVEDQ